MAGSTSNLAHTAGQVIALRRITTTTAVTVVSDDRGLVPRVAAALEREGLVAHVEAAGRDEFGERLGRRPDVVLLAGVTSAAAAAEAQVIRRRLQATHIVVVVAENARHDVRHMLECGVDGIVLEPELEATLGLVVRSVCAGHLSVPQALRHGVGLPAFSHRERQILALLVAGMSNEQIARHLYLAKSTVAGHLTSIFRRLGVRSRSEAVTLVLTADESLRRSIASAEAWGGGDVAGPGGEAR